ncbi:MAG: methyltransferase domain-containing protein [Actinobacteria bacterium]|nr:methyltransferase domain-containing protein [Actinomycetota bacterium]
MPIDKEATATWYNTAAPLYSFFRNLTRRTDCDIMPYAIGCLDLSRSDMVLDAGTGPGTYAIEIARHSTAKIIGVDISPKFVALAQKNAVAEGVPVIEFLRADLESLPFRKATFNKIICGGALQAVADRERAASELFRVLVEGGRAVVVEPHKKRSVNDRLFLIMMYLTGLAHRKLHAIGVDQLTDYFFEEETLYNLLSGAGFFQVKIELRSGTMCAVCDKQ